MTLRKLGILLCLCSATLAYAQAPRILICQERVGDVDATVMVDNYLAQELDDSGKARAIVWGLTDPVFREAFDNGILGRTPLEKPTLEQAKDAARRLKADYLVWCGAARKGDKIQGKIEIFRDGRSVLKDNQSVGVASRGELDMIGSMKSLARTWFIKISNSLLKAMPAQPKIELPEPAKGQAPEVTTPVANITKANEELQKQFEALQRSDPDAAVLFLKDAIDSLPLDPFRRRLLVVYLMKVDPKAAVLEARRATKLIPEDAELRSLAAMASIQAGNRDQARDELLEAVARQPDDIPLRMMLAEVFLRSGEPEKAIEHLDRATKGINSPDVLFLRGLCRSLLGGLDGAKADLDQAAQLNPKPIAEVSESRAQLCRVVFLEVLQKELDGCRGLIQLISVKPKDDGVRDVLESSTRTAASRGAFLERLDVPANLRAFFTSLRLAQKLHQQVLLDLADYAGKQSEESITEARLNFGEALRQFNIAKSK